MYGLSLLVISLGLCFCSFSYIILKQNLAYTALMSWLISSKHTCRRLPLCACPLFFPFGLSLTCTVFPFVSVVSLDYGSCTGDRKIEYNRGEVECYLGNSRSSHFCYKSAVCLVLKYPYVYLFIFS